MSDVGRDLFSPFDFDRLVDDGIAFALDKQERSAFVEWFRTELPGYVAHGHSLEPQALGPLSASIGRVLWNAIPLPRLGFRADAIPEPGRNDPCLCGSGRKFKQCCLKAPQLPLIDEMAVWPFLIPKLSDEQRSAAFAAKRVPIPVLAAYSDDLIAEGKQSEAIELLEPCVEPAFSVADDRAAMLIDALANAYDEAMDEEAKMSLLRRAAALPKPSPLRADALARLAAVEMDAGNREAAWEAYARAKQDCPKAENLPYLELTLLLAEQRYDEARARARTLRKALLRAGGEEAGPRLRLVDQVLSDPETALEACVYLDEDYGSLDDEELAASSPSPLQDWLDDVIERPAPQYSVVHQSLAPSDLLPPAPHAGLLVPPAELREVETRWREVFTLAKPVSIHDTPQSAADPWEGNKCSRWLAFLDEHPDAFDSLDILDDLATALTMHPDSDLDDYQDDLHGILARARNITLATQSRSPQTHLYWVTTENRPALRALFRLHSLSEIDGDEELAMDCANELLALNPHDNHGLRCWLINQHLMRSEDAQALVIAERFPGDLFAETSYGRVLALHRLGRVDEARAALAAAYEVLPKIPQYLIAEEVEEPEIYDYGMRPGGDDQAWLYREEMRAVWLGAPGAIDLLRSATEM